MSRWILLRGLTRETGHWAGFAAALAERCGGQVLGVDLPGNGDQCSRASPTDVEAIAQDVRRRVGVSTKRVRAGVSTERVRVVALSLGAMTALEWCRLDPEAIAGCALINTSTSGLSPFWHRLRPANYPTVARMLLPGLSLEERERRVLAMTSARPHAHADLPEAWAAMAREHPVRPANALRQLCAAARYRPPATAPDVPLLLLASEGDGLVSPQCSRRLANHWNLPLRMHPWAGHDLVLDDPEWVLRELLEWSRTLR